MCRIGYQDGIKTVVATPHILPGIYKNDRSTILSKLQELNETIKKFGVQSSEFVTQTIDPITQRPNNSINALRILPGADVHFSSDIFQRYERGEVMTVNDQGRYLMVEFAFQGIPYQAEEVLFQLITKGIIPIISHPERNMEIGQKPKRYYEMIRMGCLGQVTAMSLIGDFGSGIKRIAEKLLSKRLIHIIASDTHSTHRRPPILSAGVRAAEKIVGKEEAQKMVTEYPAAVIEGRRPDVPETLPPD
jgi:protein-tyrosine phosphatase